MTKKKKKTEKPARLSEAEIFAAAKEYEEATEAESRYKQAKESAKKLILTQLHSIRKVKSVESGEYGEFTRITVVEGSHVEYDGPGLYKDCTVAQRRLAFDRNINFNALPAETRKALLAAVPKDELKAVTTNVLNVERLSQAVQAGKIPGRLVAKHSEVVKSAPYIRISHGAGE